MTDFHTYHLNLLKLGYNNLIKQEPFNSEDADAVDAEFLEQFAALISAFESHEPVAYDEGQYLMARLVRAYPQLVPLVARDLFWLFGGDCLHFMPDDEISRFQQLDELRAEAEESGKAFDYLAARTRLFNQH
ncbi:PA2817 family protein [Nitrincola sp. MINF-07-Sa-05]|uniref:PA2817 family protein n=1 Tax=Nitrincola salilacus TaxID=3400273 RepID=UPI00391844A8